MKKNKFLPILIPCLSIVAASTVIIPMSVLNVKHHVTIDCKETNVHFSGDQYTYTFHLNRALQLGQTILVKTERSSFYTFENWLEPISKGPIVPEGKTFKVTMIFKSKSQKITSGDGAINVFFKCINSKKNVVWKDTIKALRFKKD